MPTVSCACCSALLERTSHALAKSAVHYCSRSCAAKVNNRLHPKRLKEGACKTCGAAISAGRTYCAPCRVVLPVSRAAGAVRTCYRCKEQKPLAGFYEQRQTGSGTNRLCKACFNQYCMERWQQKKRDAIAYLGGRCADCGGEFHPHVYDFHHLRDKDCAWNELRLRSDARIREELDKCVLLCANCHRTRHVIENMRLKEEAHPAGFEPT